MKFRRKSAVDEPPAAGEVDEAAVEQAEGPFDADDLTPSQAEGRIDLGSLLIHPTTGRELRIQVDERTGQVQAVLIAGPDGALELRAFAAPRNGDLWGDVRPQVAADMAQRGGVATEREGTFGPELVCELTTTLPDGRTGKQLSRIIGINGPRWMLRATLIGGAARTGADAWPWEALVRSVAVRRGEGAMPVGEPLPVVVPETARRVEMGSSIAPPATGEQSG